MATWLHIAHCTLHIGSSEAAADKQSGKQEQSCGREDNPWRHVPFG
jgi:hypothetical protein